MPQRRSFYLVSSIHWDLEPRGKGAVVAQVFLFLHRYRGTIYTYAGVWWYLASASSLKKVTRRV